MSIKSLLNTGFIIQINNSVQDKDKKKIIGTFFYEGFNRTESAICFKYQFDCVLCDFSCMTNTALSVSVKGWSRRIQLMVIVRCVKVHWPHVTVICTVKIMRATGTVISWKHFNNRQTSKVQSCSDAYERKLKCSLKITLMMHIKHT